MVTFTTLDGKISLRVTHNNFKKFNTPYKGCNYCFVYYTKGPNQLILGQTFKITGKCTVMGQLKSEKINEWGKVVDKTPERKGWYNVGIVPLNNLEVIAALGKKQ